MAKQLLFETVAYAESSVCRRKQLLHYFGEIYTKENCNNCDNCLHPKEKFEGKDYIITALKAIRGVKEKFKVEHVSNVLSGISNSAVKTYRHHIIPEFGSGKEKGIRFWNANRKAPRSKTLPDAD